MIVAALALSLASPFLAQDPPILVSRQRFDCLVRHIDNLPKNRRLVYVDIRTCPPQVLKGSYPRPIPPPDKDRMEWVLSLDAVEIACIRRHRRDVSAIARPEGSDKYRVSFGTCRQQAR